MDSNTKIIDDDGQVFGIDMLIRGASISLQSIADNPELLDAALGKHLELTKSALGAIEALEMALDEGNSK